MFATCSFDEAPDRADDGAMSRHDSVDERALRSARARLDRKLTRWSGRPRLGVTPSDLHTLHVQIDLFAAVVMFERRSATLAAQQQHAPLRTGPAYIGVDPTADPWLPFDAEHWFTRNPWFEA